MGCERQGATSDTVLTIAGFDPSSGAGVTADLAVFAAHGSFGISAITSLTVQSTLGVFDSRPTDPSLLRETLRHLDEDLAPSAVKIGMLADAEVVHVVADYLQAIQVRSCMVVLDPVLQASSGAMLLSEEGRAVMQERLLPLVCAITPNIDELAMLTGQTCHTKKEMEDGAKRLQERYPELSIVVTGGHTEPPDDLLLYRGRLQWFPGERLVSTATHGTGCAFSSALVCCLARGDPPERAVANAKLYVAEAIRRAVPRGGGKGPLDLLWPLTGAHRLSHR